MDFALKLRNHGKPDRTVIIDEVLGRCGLRRLKDNPARVLSFGEQQKLALARAWALKPQVLFLDEPTASLDPAATHAVEEIAGHSPRGHADHHNHARFGSGRRLADEVIFYTGVVCSNTRRPNVLTEPKNDLAQAFVKGGALVETR